MNKIWLNEEKEIKNIEKNLKKIKDISSKKEYLYRKYCFYRDEANIHYEKMINSRKNYRKNMNKILFFKRDIYYIYENKESFYFSKEMFLIYRELLRFIEKKFIYFGINNYSYTKGAGVKYDLVI
jgi:hypothetical protein